MDTDYLDPDASSYDDCPPVRSQRDLELLWRRLLHPLGFTGASLWLMFIEADDRPVPRLTEIQDADDVPEREDLLGFGQMLATLVTEAVPGGRVAFLRSRPGTGGIDDLDRAWAEALYAAARSAGVPCEVVHVATDSDVHPVPLDELVLPRSA